MNPATIEITQHAWDRFIERHGLPRPLCWRQELLQLLAESREEDLGNGIVQRLISHGYQPAAYFRSGGWRFVFDEGKERLLTCELAYKRPVQKMRKPFNRKRHGK